jgi:hypothetical protein
MNTENIVKTENTEVEAEQVKETKPKDLFTMVEEARKILRERFNFPVEKK